MRKMGFRGVGGGDGQGEGPNTTMKIYKLTGCKGRSQSSGAIQWKTGVGDVSDVAGSPAQLLPAAKFGVVDAHL